MLIPAAAIAAMSSPAAQEPPSILSKSTKIVATLGPASSSEDVMRRLMQAGVNVFRLNFSHGTQTDKQATIQQIRRLSGELSLYVAIMADLQGPKFRLGETSDHKPIQVKKGDHINLKSGEQQKQSTQQTLVTGTKHAHSLLPHLQPQHRVLINDGAIVLQVDKRISDTEVACTVLVGGPLGEHKGINVPDLKVPLPALTDKDTEDALFALKEDVDYFALSFVQRGEDVLDLRKLLQDNIAEGRMLPKIIAKIEKPQAIEAIDEIVAVVDGLMVARGDLGVEASYEKVPAYQKMMIAKCNVAGKPVIVATQMIESMIEQPQPTRAEVSDIFNAVYDGADATMLSAESAAGKYPVEAVTAMATIVREAERNQKPTVVDEQALDIAIGTSAVAAATQGLKAKALILVCVSYELALHVSKLRPTCPVIVVTFSSKLAATIDMCYGCHTIVLPELHGSGDSTDSVLLEIENAIAKRGWMQHGDSFVFACGDSPLPGLKNSLQLGTFGEIGGTRDKRRKWSHLIEDAHVKELEAQQAAQQTAADGATTATQPTKTSGKE